MAKVISVSGEGASAVTTYALVNYTDNAVAGAFSDVTFFTDDILATTVYESTADVVSSGYAFFEGAVELMYQLHQEFQKGFASDLLTLARKVIFWLLIWLITAGWLCFGFRHGNLMPILDAIKHPVRNGGGKGIDLFRIVSLGAISIETEFGLGRFLCYEGIMALLLLVVWKSGNITI